MTTEPRRQELLSPVIVGQTSVARSRAADGSPVIQAISQRAAVTGPIRCGSPVVVASAVASRSGPAQSAAPSRARALASTLSATNWLIADIRGRRRIRSARWAAASASPLSRTSCASQPSTYPVQASRSRSAQ